MTAEIAILNKSAIALAADSAVSVGESADKIFATNKLFTLSKYHPVGIMIFNNAQFLGVPLETIIKEHRRALGDSSQTELVKYGQAFVSYLTSAGICSEEQVKHHVQSVFDEYFKDLAEEILHEFLAAFSKTGRYSKKEAATVANRVFGQHLTRLQKRQMVASLEDVTADGALKLYEQEYANAKKNRLSNTLINKKAEAQLRSIAGELLIRNRWSGAYSGIVIAGFGSNDLFPSLLQYNVDGVVAGRLKFSQIRHSVIKPGGSEAIVIPFAEREMADRFMEGIDSEYVEYLDYGVRRLLENLSNEIINSDVPGSDDEKATKKSAYKDTIEKMIDDFSTRARAHRMKEFVRPVIDTIIGMPKHELANMAEALVNLQSMKQHVTWEKETVGGPIDVAVISKGDGFVWIKRKHYFEQTFNPHFLENYFRH